MFNLIYRDGAPENTGHYEGIPTDATDLKVGQAVIINSAGKVESFGDGTAKVYGVVAGEIVDGVVKVLKVTGDMVFKTVTTVAPAAKGAKVAISAAAKVTASAPASGKYGAIMVDNLGAAAGGFVEVSFEV